MLNLMSIVERKWILNEVIKVLTSKLWILESYQ